MNARSSSIVFLILASAFAVLPRAVNGQDREPFELTNPVGDRSVLAAIELNSVARAEQAAALDVSKQQERILRWNLVAVADADAVVDRETLAPLEQINVTVFPGVSFLATHTSHRIRDWSVNWYGSITKGGSGTVHISVVLDEKGAPAAFVYIRSDIGDFNIWPIDASPYSMAAESNKWLRESVDSE